LAAQVSLWARGAAAMFLVKDPSTELLNTFDGPEIVTIGVMYADDVVSVTVAGELDVSNRIQLYKALHDAIDTGASEVVLDVAALTFIDSTGVRVLESAHNRMHTVGGTLAVVNPKPNISKLLDITGLLSILTVRRLRPKVAAQLDAS
jgi:anti-anti-sigma factor